MNLQEIKELIKTMDDSTISSIAIKDKNFSIKLDKNSSSTSTAMPTPVVSAAPVQTIMEQEPIVELPPLAIGDKITSPMVGTFYKSPSPDSPAYVKIGDTVSQGDTLAIIEAMKIMNELEAEFDCKIVDILVKDGQVVEYDTPLFVIERI